MTDGPFTSCLFLLQSRNVSRGTFHLTSLRLFYIPIIKSKMKPVLYLERQVLSNLSQNYIQIMHENRTFFNRIAPIYLFFLLLL
jgi:hypothetical protein